MSSAWFISSLSWPPLSYFFSVTASLSDGTLQPRMQFVAHLDENTVSDADSWLFRAAVQNMFF
jgi:hypothetical protein